MLAAALSVALAGAALAQASSTNPASGGSDSPYDNGGAPQPSTGTANPSR
jgi:hypothetical protein